ncbi:acetyl-CoA C-acyltransferase [Terriglobus albidus]|uniref:Acetyl-CoA C-acyltransferase n=1 Tax=Terriglobus albidus TaxID=1592106 RepID=A0A5B9EH02_9BACT|nr:beta-ketothiolase BktB [Terriglobus albidus]QEE30090.1 acetyl-CoA C-acyltransferase [Terriglobus albidus]
MREVVVLSAVRTAVGKFGGALKDLAPSELAATVTRESVERSGLDPAEIAHVVFGNVIHTDAKDMYLARVAALRGGLPVETSALTLNRLCGSGLQAIVTSAQAIVHGDAEAAVAGGTESMSRAPYWMNGLRWGARLNDTAAVDAMVGALTDPFEEIHMGVTAENIARKWDISREAQDALAAESHRRALDAIASGKFTDQIVPIELKTKGGTIQFDTDESPRTDATIQNLTKLKPVFDKAGTVTAGNSSSINDGAAAVVLMERRAAEERGLAPLAKLVDYTVTGVEPGFMGIGPVSAVRRLLQRTGLTIDQIDVFEVNEAFAAQALAVATDLGLPSDKTNPNGSGISLGHPLGATGAIVTVKALHELRRIGGRYALVTMCIGGGQGIAAIFEAVNS